MTLTPEESLTLSRVAEGVESIAESLSGRERIVALEQAVATLINSGRQTRDSDGIVDDAIGRIGGLEHVAQRTEQKLTDLQKTVSDTLKSLDSKLNLAQREIDSQWGVIRELQAMTKVQAV